MIQVDVAITFSIVVTLVIFLLLDRLVALNLHIFIIWVSDDLSRPKSIGSATREEGALRRNSRRIVRLVDVGLGSILLFVLLWVISREGIVQVAQVRDITGHVTR